MCRFLLAKSKNKFDPRPILTSFSTMAEKSKAFDGDWQGDGWGVSYLENGKWKAYTSLEPVWKEEHNFENIPRTKALALHARSASFEKDKGILTYNQPYVNEIYAFVFNGLIKGVSLGDLKGDIGAQKIWSLLESLLMKYAPEEALQKLKKIITNKSREVQAFNIGLATSTHIFALNVYNKHPEYYALHYKMNNEISLICSEKLESDWKEFHNGEINIF